MKISVVIPVYNAEKYVVQAVESALMQPETDEVILIEDASPDNALEICLDLEKKYEKVKLFQHPDKKNHGAGASRNVGLEKAKNNYIAFLDADDFYLKNRFTEVVHVFEKNDTIDGVYGAVGTLFQDEASKQRFSKSRPDLLSITTMKKSIDSVNLFEALLSTRCGHFCLEALIFKKSILKKAGFFNENLLLAQDTEWILKVAATSKLVPNALDIPIAMRRVHSCNRMDADMEKTAQAAYLVIESLVQWVKKDKSVPKSAKGLILYLYFTNTISKNLFLRYLLLPVSLVRLIILFAEFPSFMFSTMAVKSVGYLFSQKLAHQIFKLFQCKESHSL